MHCSTWAINLLQSISACIFRLLRIWLDWWCNCPLCDIMRLNSVWKQTSENPLKKRMFHLHLFEFVARLLCCKICPNSQYNQMMEFGVKHTLIFPYAGMAMHPLLDEAGAGWMLRSALLVVKVNVSLHCKQCHFKVFAFDVIVWNHEQCSMQ